MRSCVMFTMRCSRPPLLPSCLLFLLLLVLLLVILVWPRPPPCPALLATNLTAPPCPTLLQSGSCVGHHPGSTAQRSRECDLTWAEWGTVTEGELAFPLAYTVTVQQGEGRELELLLASVFRPHNAYCIHVDSGAASESLRTVVQLVDCYTARYTDSTIFLPSYSAPSSAASLQSELVCMAALQDLPLDWRYTISLAGSELQLATNRELVTLLASAPGEMWLESELVSEAGAVLPHNLTLYRGAGPRLLPRTFVQFLLSHPVSRAVQAAAPDPALVVASLARVSRAEAGNNMGWEVEQHYTPRPPDSALSSRQSDLLPGEAVCLLESQQLRAATET